MISSLGRFCFSVLKRKMSSRVAQVGRRPVAELDLAFPDWMMRLQKWKAPGQGMTLTSHSPEKRQSTGRARGDAAAL